MNETEQAMADMIAAISHLTQGVNSLVSAVAELQKRVERLESRAFFDDE